MNAYKCLGCKRVDKDKFLWYNNVHFNYYYLHILFIISKFDETNVIKFWVDNEFIIVMYGIVICVYCVMFEFLIEELFVMGFYLIVYLKKSFDLFWVCTNLVEWKLRASRVSPSPYKEIQENPQNAEQKKILILLSQCFDPCEFIMWANKLPRALSQFQLSFSHLQS